MWQGRAKRKRARAARNGASSTSVPRPAPRRHHYMPCGGLQACLQCVIGLRRTSARQIPGFVRLERERKAPTRSAHLRITGANVQLATRIAAWRLARRLGWRGKGWRSVVIGGAMHGRTRSQPPFRAPARATVWGVGGGVCQCMLARRVPIQCLHADRRALAAPLRRWETRATRIGGSSSCTAGLGCEGESRRVRSPHLSAEQ